MKNEELRVKSEEFAAAMNNEAIKTMGFFKALMCSVALVLCSSFFISCSEDDNEIEEYEVSGNHIQGVWMKPGWTHNIINLSDTEDLVTVMWANEQFDPDKPDTFFEVVE